MSFLDIPFEGIGQLRQQLEAHEEEILARINEPGLVSVFRSRLVENIKTCSNTCYV